MSNIHRVISGFGGAFALTYLLFGPRAAADPVETVTIAATATMVGEVPHYTRANERAVEDGWLAAQLKRRGISLKWIPGSDPAGNPRRSCCARRGALLVALCAADAPGLRLTCPQPTARNASAGSHRC